MDSFIYYGARSAPFVHQDRLNISSSLKSSRPKVLSEITNNYAKEKSSKKTVKLLDIKTDVSDNQSKTYSLLLTFKRTKFTRPDSRVLKFQTSIPALWTTEGDKLVADNSHLSNSYNIKRYASSFVVTVGASDIKVLSQTRYNLLASSFSLAHKRIAIETELFNTAIVDSSSNDINYAFASSLKSVSKMFDVEIYISCSGLFGADMEFNSPYVYIFGPENNLAGAELRCKLLLDDLKGLKVHSLDIDLSLISLVSGTKLDNFRNVIKQTGVYINMPQIFPSTDNVFKTFGNNNQIFISGVESHVLHAKFLLKKMKTSLKDDIFFKDVRINETKLSYMLLKMVNGIKKIMYDNGSFIQFPSLGSSSDSVRVQAISEHSVEKTITDLMELASTVYELDVNIRGLPKTLNFEPILTEIAHNTDTFMTFKRQNVLNIKIMGKNQNTLSALHALNELRDSSNKVDMDFNSSLSRMTQETNNGDNLAFEFRFGIELFNTEKEFICGKKNGKLIKIMNSTSTRITFTPVNEYNFKIEISSDTIRNLEKGVNLLELEFPSQTSFYIPEIYHRQMIGVGGNLIQSIMRKYNVFIKFSNTFKMKQQEFSFKRFDNVLIKCPNKNSLSIPQAKKELEAAVKSCQESKYINFKLSEDQYSLFLNNFKCSAINEIEKKTNSFIDFPTVFSSGNSADKFYDLVEIRAIDTRSAVEAFKLLQEELPREQKITVSAPISASFNIDKIISATNEEFLNKIIIPFKIFLNTNVKVLGENLILTSYSGSEGNEVQAIEALSSYLRSYDFKITNIESLQTSYNILDIKKPAGFVKTHGYSQSLNLNYKPVPSYKQSFMRSPPVYSGPELYGMSQHSPIECEISNKFNFPTQQMPSVTYNSNSRGFQLKPASDIKKKNSRFTQ